MTLDKIWLGIGLLGQGLFFMRFFIQWIVSERRGESVIPRAFWYFSLAGGATLFFYALHKEDIVFVVGQGSGLLIYVRNMMLTQKRDVELAAAEAG